MLDITVGVATHKSYEMPNEKIYLPIQSGAALNKLNLGYQKDNEGINISKKNLNYSELTALYWLWKNNNSRYKGLVHYRRFFSDKTKSSMFETGKFEDVLSEKKLNEIFENYDIVLPFKRKYYIETIETHYQHTHYEQDLEVTKKVINELYPEYIDTYEKVLRSKSAHMFNMFIMKDNLFNSYCEWLFSILFEIEKQLDISEYSNFNKRVFGRISEILLDVWIYKNHLEFIEVPLIFMEKQNWYKKINKFLKSKFLRIKY